MRRKTIRWRARLNPLELAARQNSSLKQFFKKSRRKINKRLILGYLIYFVSGIFILLIILFAWYSKDLPNPNTLSHRKIPQSTKIFDREGHLLYEFHGEQKRTVVKSDDISKYVKEATLAIEDKNFYKHHGVDLEGVLKAIYRKITGQRSKLAGGSTITQQYIKNALLTNERSFSRKIKELILSLEIEQIYSKDEILTGYLNQIPYGNNAYGIEAAAKTYFDKSAKDLTLSESAFLAGLPQAPSYYNNHPKASIKRKNHILDEMVECGFITKKEATLAKKETPNEDNIGFKTNINHIKAPHFVFYVRDHLLEMLGGGQEAEMKLLTTGFRVTTTLDPQIQEAAEKAVESNRSKLNKFGASNAALTAVDPKTGQILAMVGSVDFKEARWGSVNVADSKRQPGSSFKPIVYATAFKDKYTPAFTLWDVPTRLDQNKSEIWPHNYDRTFNGPLTIRQALQWSLNVPAVKMLALVKLPKAIQTARDLGISTLSEKNNYGLSLVLGSGEVKLTELTNAYATFSNGGKFNPLTPILKIETPDGRVIEEFKERGKQVLDPQIAYQISHILSDDSTRSARWGKTPLRLSNRYNVAAKTGTTSSFKDAWTVGYTTQLAAGVWVGNNDASPMKVGADGLFVAAPIWNAFMTEALDRRKWPNESFPRPSGIKEIKIDKLSGKLPTDLTPPDSIVTEVLASWQIPTEKDDVHIKVRINKLTGKLASNNTPADLIEEKYFTIIHSEKLDDPVWENPVRQWAKEHGMGDLPPTEKDDVYSEESRPKITINSPRENDKVSGNTKVIVSVSSSYKITQVDFYIDDNAIGSITTEPYEYIYDFNKLPTGNHTLEVIAKNELGMVDRKSISIQTINDNIPPGEVSGVVISAELKYVNLTWNNPSDPDLDHVVIYLSTQSGKLGLKYGDKYSALPNTSSSAKIEGLTSGTTYYFTLHTVDSSGNESQSLTQYSATPL